MLLPLIPLTGSSNLTCLTVCKLEVKKYKKASCACSSMTGDDNNIAALIGIYVYIYL